MADNKNKDFSFDNGKNYQSTNAHTQGLTYHEISKVREQHPTGQVPPGEENKGVKV